MSDIFLCYSRSDSATAHKLVEHLRGCGWTVFIDVQTLRVGDRWDKAIEGELFAARAIVALWSARSRDSEYVLEEAEYGRKQGILFPVLIEAVAPPYGFNRVQTADLIGWQGDGTHPGLVKLVAALEHRLGRPESEAEGEAPKASTGSARAPKRETPPQTPPQPEVRPKVATPPKQPPPPPQAPGGGDRPVKPNTLPKLIAAGVAGLAVVGVWISGGNPSNPPAAVDAPPPSAAPPRPLTFKAGQRFRDCEDAACPWLVVVPGGEFLMGSPESEKGRYKDESPQHPVRIAEPFAVTEAEVTRGQFAQFVAETKYQAGEGCLVWSGKSWEKDAMRNWRDPGFAQTDEHPVVCVSWKDATTFASWLSKRTGEKYRLLSEAEWECAARSGTKTRFVFGDADESVCANAQVSCKGIGSAGGTASVKHFKPNAFGLYDMHGNAWEWVQDCGHGNYEGAPADGKSWEKGCSENSRVLRGGGWGSAPDDARSAYRVGDVPVNRSYLTGFRLARTLTP